MKAAIKTKIKQVGLSVLGVVGLLLVLGFSVLWNESSYPQEETWPVSDHFDGKTFFNPWDRKEASDPEGGQRQRGTFWYLWRWLTADGRPQWPEIKELPPAPRPPFRVAQGKIRITIIGHATFLIQMDGVNILTDPIWSERCSPVSWAGPRRYQPPGIPFQDLPPIDVILISHNHYDHMDLPTLRRLATSGTPRALVPLGNRALVAETGIPQVEALDWWDSVTLRSRLTVTMVPARHFSGRTPWDRNRTLWGGYVVSGPSGTVYFAGDTAYGPHIQEIGKKYFPITVALLPISPFRTGKPNDHTPSRFSRVHMGPNEAVRAHLDLKAGKSIAAHFRVFRLGWDGFDDAINELFLTLQKEQVPEADFIVPDPGRSIETDKGMAGTQGEEKGKRVSAAR
jgi:L-ascorbate metabolism protein UlaG (beta-lactamase superfamily)